MRLKWLYFASGFVLTVSITRLGDTAQYIPDSAISPNITRNSQIAPTGENNGICVSNTGTPTPAIVLCSTVDLTGKTLLFRLPEYAIANLPATHPLSIITNGADGADCVKGGGSTRVLCAWNGSAWASIGGGTGTGNGDITDVLQTNNQICVTNPGGPQPQVSLCPTVDATASVLQLGRTDLAGVISPTTLAAQADDWNPTGLATASTIRITSTGPQSISGISGGATGRILTLHNYGSSVVTLLNQSTGSTANNRFTFGANVLLGPNQGVLIQYDSTTSRWRLVGGIGSGDNYCADAGATDAYACNLSPAITAYRTGTVYRFKANTANTGAASLALNGLAAITIKKAIGTITTDLQTNDIRAGQIVDVVYDGTNFQMQSTLGNSPTGISNLTPGVIPLAQDATHIVDSSISEDANNVLFSKPPVWGECVTDCLTEDRTSITGEKTLYYPNHTGWLPTSPNARKSISVELFDSGTDVTTGTGKAYIRVPTNFNTMNLVAVATNVILAGTTGATSVQITKCSAAGTSDACSGITVTQLSTVVSIDSGENSSTSAATPAAIKADGSETVITGDLLRFDVTAVSGTAPKGLIVTTEWELP